MHTLKLAMLSVLCITISSCAYIIRTGQIEEPVQISTTPPNAKVIVFKKNYWSRQYEQIATEYTPCQLYLEGCPGYKIIISKSGFRSSEFIIEGYTRWYYFLNWPLIPVVIGLIGALVDCSSGAAYDLEPNYININLAPMNSYHEL